MALFLLLSLLVFSASAQQYDPLVNYCKILDHQCTFSLAKRVVQLCFGEICASF